jgi:hypothetical protein
MSVTPVPPPPCPKIPQAKWFQEIHEQDVKERLLYNRLKLRRKIKRPGEISQI